MKKFILIEVKKESAFILEDFVAGRSDMEIVLTTEGERCVLSELGRLRLPREAAKNRQGLILGNNDGGAAYRVRWDGVKTPYTYHKSFIKVLK